MTKKKDNAFEIFKSSIGVSPLKIVLDDRRTKMPPIDKDSLDAFFNDGVSTKGPRGLDAVAGMKDLKALAKRDFVDIIKNKELASLYDIKPAPMLLYGPPGSGKTFFANRLAEEVGVNFMNISPDDIANIYVHGTQQKIAKVFKRAIVKAPTILFFDEFDSMCPDRASAKNQNVADEVAEFLTQMNNAADKGVYVITATNHPEAIDRAVLRSGRIDNLIYVPLPDKEARKELFRLELMKCPRARNISLEKLADLTQNYTASDITCIVKDAARKAFEEASRSNAKDVVPVKQKFIEDVIANRSSSVNERDIRFYERLRDEFSPKQKNSRKKTIGFV